MDTSVRAARWSAWLAAGLIAAFVFIAFFEARLKSPTSDEPPHIAAGLSYFVTHQIFRANPQHPPLLKELSALSVMAAGIRWPHTPDADYLVNGDDPGRVFQMEWPVGNEVVRMNGPDRILAWARLPMILVAALLGALTFIWGRQFFGPLAAVAAAFVFVLDPTILAHSQFVTTDVGVTSFSMLALLALWMYLRKPGWIRLILCGLSLGAALAAKFSALFLLPIFGLLLLASIRWPLTAATGKPVPRQLPPDSPCHCGSGRKYKNCHGRLEAGARPKSDLWRQLAIAAGALAVMCLVAFVFVQATYFFPGDLAMYAKCARMVNADHDPNYQSFLAGELGRRFPSYFLVAYVLKQPVAGMILALVGLIALIRSQSVPVLGKLFLLIPPVVFFAVATLFADNLGVRYIIPVLPFAHLLAGLGIATMVGSARRFKWAPYAAAGLCAWLVLAAAGIYPDHLSYFNETACLFSDPGQIGWDGGTRCGTAWLDDSNVDWGQGLKQLKVWLDRNAPGRTVKLAIVTPFPPDAYGIRYQPIGGQDLAKEPAPGLYAITAHLIGRLAVFSYESAWVRRARPVAIVGHAIYVYDIREGAPK
jgi:hypothetical protein